MILFECESISKSFREKQIFDKVNLEIKKNELVSLVALNGQGKTTFFKMITRLAFPDRGSFLYKGEKKPKENLIFFVPETTKGFPLLNVRETIDFFSKLECNQLDDRSVEELLLKAELEKETNKTGSFSKGMRQKLWLCLAALSSSELIIIDEPLSGLDIKGRKFFKYICSKIKDKGNTLLYSSHDLETVFDTSERFLFIEKNTRKIISRNKEDFHGIKEFKEIFENLSG